MSKMFMGVVVSDKGDKTIVVSISTRKTHPVYKKQYTITKKIMVHDEENVANIGDQVVIKEVRPLSARKRHMLDKIIEKAAIGLVETKDADPDIFKKTVQPIKSKKAEAVVDNEAQVAKEKK